MPTGERSEREEVRKMPQGAFFPINFIGWIEMGRVVEVMR
jgi:hypothetical protein